MDDLVKQDGWLLIKRGLYWRPDRQGYTGLKREAGRYTLEEVKSWAEERDITSIHQDDAPEFSGSCYSDIKDKVANEQAARIAALEAALEPFNKDFMAYESTFIQDNLKLSIDVTMGDLRRAKAAMEGK